MAYSPPTVVIIFIYVAGEHVRCIHFIKSLNTAKPAERQKKLAILGDVLAKPSEPQHCKFQLESLPVPLTSNSSVVRTGHCILTALGPC